MEKRRLCPTPFRASLLKSCTEGVHPQCGGYARPPPGRLSAGARFLRENRVLLQQFPLKLHPTCLWGGLLTLVSSKIVCCKFLCFCCFSWALDDAFDYYSLSQFYFRISDTTSWLSNNYLQFWKEVQDTSKWAPVMELETFISVGVQVHIWRQQWSEAREEKNYV